MQVNLGGLGLTVHNKNLSKVSKKAKVKKMCVQQSPILVRAMPSISTSFHCFNFTLILAQTWKFLCDFSKSQITKHSKFWFCKQTVLLFLLMRSVTTYRVNRQLFGTYGHFRKNLPKQVRCVCVFTSEGTYK